MSVEKEIVNAVNKILLTNDRVRVKELNSRLEMLIASRYKIVESAQSSSYNYDDLMEKLERLKMYSTNIVFLRSFYDDIMSIISISFKEGEIVGISIEKMTDGGHWKRVILYVDDRNVDIKNYLGVS